MDLQRWFETTLNKDGYIDEPARAAAPRPFSLPITQSKVYNNDVVEFLATDVEQVIEATLRNEGIAEFQILPVRTRPARQPASGLGVRGAGHGSMLTILILLKAATNVRPCRDHPSTWLWVADVARRELIRLELSQFNVEVRADDAGINQSAYIIRGPADPDRTILSTEKLGEKIDALLLRRTDDVWEHYDSFDISMVNYRYKPDDDPFKAIVFRFGPELAEWRWWPLEIELRKMLDERGFKKLPIVVKRCLLTSDIL